LGARVVRRRDEEVGRIGSRRCSVDLGVGVGAGNVHAVRRVAGSARYERVRSVVVGQAHWGTVSVGSDAGQTVVVDARGEVCVRRLVLQAVAGNTVPGAAANNVLQFAGNANRAEGRLRTNRVIVVVVAGRRSVVAEQRRDGVRAVQAGGQKACRLL